MERVGVTVRRVNSTRSSLRSLRSFAIAPLFAAIGLSAGCGGATQPAASTTSPSSATATATPTPAQATPAAAPAETTARPTAQAFPVTPANQAIVDAKDRTPEDRALDAGRHPAETLSFFGIGPGMKVAEVISGGGYTTELLARAVGPTGTVYGQNNKGILGFVDKAWAARLARPVTKNVVRVDREADDPFPPEAHDLDAVVDVLFYHDLYWLNVDRAKHNAAIFKALKSGGVYAIIDHSGRPGTGSTETKTLHRIEEKTLREDVEKAGFRLAAEASFLRNPDDARDWNAAPNAAAERRGKSDRFALKYVKP